MPTSSALPIGSDGTAGTPGFCPEMAGEPATVTMTAVIPAMRDGPIRIVVSGLRRNDVLIDLEKILGVVLALDLRQARIIRSVGFVHPTAFIVAENVSVCA